MDDARYVFGVLIVTFLPPGIVWWFIVHPFIDFWRKVGARGTISTMVVLSVLAIGGLMTIRDTLLMADYGSHAILMVLAAGLATAGVWIALHRRKHLTIGIMAGIPQLEPTGKGGQLLSEGIYGKIRHPRYVEIVLFTLAYAFFANYQGAYFLALATMPLIHLIVLLEERELVQRFGEEYKAYMTQVPRYIPERRE